MPARTGSAFAAARTLPAKPGSFHYIDEAQKRNFQRWPILGTYVWPNAYIGQSYFDELQYLKHWVNLRILWMDARIPGRPTHVTDTAAQGPLTFALEQNYPNPFNPATTIAFYLPRAGRVALKIFDVNGQEAATLVQGEMPAGRHEIKFAAQDCASGVYFYRLQMDDYTASRKLLYMR